MNISLTRSVALGSAAAALAVGGGISAWAHAGEGHPVAAPKKMKVSMSTRPAPSGVLVHLVTRGFRWAPEHMSPVHGEGKVVKGEGHGHIYVDGAEMPATMVVSDWTYLKLDPGKHTLRVTLNADNHEEYQRSGKPVQDSVSVKVPAASME